MIFFTLCWLYKPKSRAQRLETAQKWKRKPRAKWIRPEQSGSDVERGKRQIDARGPNDNSMVDVSKVKPLPLRRWRWHHSFWTTTNKQSILDKKHLHFWVNFWKSKKIGVDLIIFFNCQTYFHFKFVNIRNIWTFGNFLHFVNNGKLY